MNTSEIIPKFFLTIVLLIALVHDIRFKKIPNWLTFTTIAVAVPYHTVTNGVAGFLFSIEGVGVGIAVLIIPYLMGGMGAGDAKLMGAIGGVLGPKGVFVAFLSTALVGGFYALIILAFCGYLKIALRRYWMILKNLIFFGKFFYLPPSEEERKPLLRYGIAISLGTLFSVFMGNKILELMNFI